MPEPRTVEAVVPPEPARGSVVLSAEGVAFQHAAFSTWPRMPWFAAIDQAAAGRGVATWLEILAAGPVTILWEPPPAEPLRVAVEELARG